MFSRRLYLKIVANVVFILLISGGGIVLIVSQWAIIIGILLIIGAVFQTKHLVSILNNTNKRIALFFDTIQDNELISFFPEENTDKEEQQLNHTFNRIGHLVNASKLQSQRQELFYKALLEHIPSGVMAWDDKGKVLLANNAVLRLLGFSFLNHVGQIQERHPDFKPIIQPTDGRRSFDLRIETERGHRQLAAIRTSMILQEQRLTLLSLQDIQEQLDEKESESWIRLTHILTHEIMNSIAPITSLSETLSSYFEKDGVIKTKEELSDTTIQKTVKGLSIVKRRGKSLLHFAESYRKLTFIPTPVLKRFPLGEFTDNLTHLLQPELKTGGIDLKTQIPGNLSIAADEELLAQVLINLIKNAIQALEGIPEGKIIIAARQENHQTYIEVSDNGKGIPANLLEDIFVPFFTTKPSGSGIGLSLSRQIIRLHGGDLSVVSTPHKKTCFLICLPIV